MSRAGTRRRDQATRPSSFCHLQGQPQGPRSGGCSGDKAGWASCKGYRAKHPSTQGGGLASAGPVCEPWALLLPWLHRAPALNRCPEAFKILPECGPPFSQVLPFHLLDTIKEVWGFVFIFSRTKVAVGR